ncbi:MAG: glycoside hydrolase family 125 protein [Myxococcales bacterium]|jgi:hypothetical protein
MAKVIEGRILTTPEELSGESGHLPTGNEYVSIPTVRLADAAIERIGALHLGLASLLEVCGGARAGKTPSDEALLAPLLRVDGEEKTLSGALTWQRLSYFVPRFIWGKPGQQVHLEGAIFAPAGEKGFVYLLRAHNPESADKPVKIGLGLKGQWGDTLQTVFTSGRIFGAHRAHFDRWTAGPVFEVRPGPAILGWALMPSAPLDVCDWRPADPSSVGSYDHKDFATAAGQPIAYEFSKEVEVTPGGWAELALYFGVNREGDGARTCAIDLARQGWQKLLDKTLAWLERRAVSLPRLQGAEREKMERLCNLNLFFNYFFALGRCIDTEELALVTSRSPLYYVSAAFWARDALLWSLPAVVLVEPSVARQMLEEAFGRYLKHAGIHALYMDGRLLYPGFELDELCAYVVALDHYMRQTGDETLVREPAVQSGLRRVESLLFARKNVGEWLFETYLYPSDDPAQWPYITYDNALVALTFDILQSWSDRGFLDGKRSAAWSEDVKAWGDMAEKVRAAIRKHLVVEGPFGPMFAWGADIECEKGQPGIYDEPPGSLQLLAYYKLCSPDDAVFKNTVRWIHSEHNPYSYRDCRFPGVGCPHSEHPFVMGLFNNLLCGRIDEAKAVLLEAPLDAGLACEAFDREAGTVKTGAAFATCAGFLAYAIARTWS